MCAKYLFTVGFPRCTKELEDNLDTEDFALSESGDDGNLTTEALINQEVRNVLMLCNQVLEL